MYIAVRMLGAVILLGCSAVCSAFAVFPSFLYRGLLNLSSKCIKINKNSSETGHRGWPWWLAGCAVDGRPVAVGVLRTGSGGLGYVCVHLCTLNFVY